MENKEREITVGKLLWKLLYGWRCLLIGALTVAVLAASVFYIKDRKAYEELQNQRKEVVSVNDYAFTKEQVSQIENAKYIQNLMDKNDTYMAESVLMNTDPYDETVLLLRYYVKSDYQFNYTEANSMDYTKAVIAAYEEYTQNGELAQKVIDAMGLDIEKKYMEELIQFERVGEAEIFSIAIIYPDKDKLVEMADIIHEEVNKKTEIISERIGSHSLELLSENVTVRTDMQLVNLQKSNLDISNAYNTQLSGMKASMTAEQLEVLAADNKVKTEDKPEETVSAVKPGFHVKYIILGFFAGLFLAAMWIVCKMLFTGKLQESGELTEMYGLREFGVLHTKDKISGVDRLISKIRNSNKKQMDLEQCFDIISSNIELTCKAEGISQVYLTGTEIENVDSNLVQSMIEKMNQAGIKAVYGKNVCYDAKSLRQLTESKYVILIEQEEVSRYQEIEKEVKMITQQNVKVLGCVGINTKY